MEKDVLRKLRLKLFMHLNTCNKLSQIIKDIEGIYCFKKFRMIFEKYPHLHKKAVFGNVAI